MPISLSTAADQVGHACAVLKPLHELLARHVLAAERLHGDDTTVPVLAKGKTDKGRLWVGACPGLDPGSATIGRSWDRHHRRRYSIIPVIGAASIRNGTWPDTPGCSRLMPMRVMVACLMPGASLPR